MQAIFFSERSFSVSSHFELFGAPMQKCFALRLGTTPLPDLLSGHRANEVANRQDADPIHFVSSVFIACAGWRGERKQQNPLLEGFVVFCERITRLAS
ncbi:hypothetical protein HN51_11045 [Ectopseudomonas mendocina]|uniref:Uncharacterized protein n=1 Tax=Ectopseudomonas mendocina S5.2 TaxID=1225174 RepID=A0ABN4ISX3_ECTME|nr:hypothetical protein DW68_009140 [Pseudomonas mendocina S5.2]KES00359.1 hypothetical protein HN51_11045 [Pseudomonas mendocina]